MAADSLSDHDTEQRSGSLPELHLLGKAVLFSNAPNIRILETRNRGLHPEYYSSEYANEKYYTHALLLLARPNCEVFLARL